MFNMSNSNRRSFSFESLESRQMLSAVPWASSAEVAVAADSDAIVDLLRDTVAVAEETDLFNKIGFGSTGKDGETHPSGVHHDKQDLGAGNAFDKLPYPEIFQEIGELEGLNKGLEEAFAFRDLEGGVPGQPNGPTVNGLQQRVFGDGSSGTDMGFGSGLSAMDRIHNQFSNDAPPSGRGIGSDPRVGDPPGTSGPDNCNEEQQRYEEEMSEFETSLLRFAVTCTAAAIPSPMSGWGALMCVSQLPFVSDAGDDMGEAYDDLQECLEENSSDHSNAEGEGCPPKGGEDDDGYKPGTSLDPGSGSEPAGWNPLDQGRVGQGNPEEQDHGGLTPIEASGRPATPLTTLDVTGQPGLSPGRSVDARPFTIESVVNPGKHF